jgi:RNA polymerase sigma factor (sigma-70 family)
VSSAKYKQHSDPQLVAMCLSGDALAWETLIIRYRRLIFSVPVRFGFPPADAADVFQGVCVKLLEHLHEVKDETKISAWLITTTTRQCIHLKSLRHRESGIDEDFEEPADPADNMEEVQIFSERQQAVRDAVEELASRCRSLVAMLYFDSRNLSYDEIGREMGMPVASVGPTRARCLEKLRMILRRKGLK